MMCLSGKVRSNKVIPRGRYGLTKNLCKSVFFEQHLIVYFHMKKQPALRLTFGIQINVELIQQKYP